MQGSGDPKQEGGALRVLIIAASSRSGSYNARLARAAQDLARRAGAHTTWVDLRALDLPLYDGDLEAARGVPQGARALRDLFASHDALILSSPEYNALPTPLLLNSFDWLSRVQAEGLTPAGAAATAGKVAGLLAASPGAYGGVRALPMVRQFLSTNFGMLVVPEHFALSHADAAFDDAGLLKQPAAQAGLERVVGGVLRVGSALRKSGAAA